MAQHPLKCDSMWRRAIWLEGSKLWWTMHRNMAFSLHWRVHSSTFLYLTSHRPQCMGTRYIDQFRRQRFFLYGATPIYFLVLSRPHSRRRSFAPRGVVLDAPVGQRPSKRGTKERNMTNILASASRIACAWFFVNMSSHSPTTNKQTSGLLTHVRAHLIHPFGSWCGKNGCGSGLRGSQLCPDHQVWWWGWGQKEETVWTRKMCKTIGLGKDLGAWDSHCKKNGGTLNSHKLKLFNLKVDSMNEVIHVVKWWEVKYNKIASIIPTLQFSPPQRLHFASISPQIFTLPYCKGSIKPVQLTQFLPDASIRKRRRTFGAKAIRRCPVSHLSPEGTKEEKEEERENAVAHIAASNIQQLVASYVATSSSTAPVRRCPAQTQTPTQSQTRSCQYGPSFHHRHSASWSCSHHPSPAGESSNPSPTQTSSQTLISSMLTPSVDARERLQHPLLGWSKSTR